MAKKRRRRPPEALVFREGEVCVPATRRGARPHTRKVIVDCETVPRRRRPEEPAFTPHCTNETCQCGVSYDKFRSGWTFAEAAEMVGARGKGGGVQTFRPSRAKILRMMARLKRDEWEAHQRACAGASAPARGAEDYDAAYWAALPEDDFLAGTKTKKKRKPKKAAQQSAFRFENDSFALTVQDAPESWGKFTATEQKQMKLLSGWKRRAPSRVTERREMPKACFLAPGLKYPICPKGTRGKVRVDCAGLQAAYARARQQGDAKVAKRARALQQKHCRVS